MVNTSKLCTKLMCTGGSLITKNLKDTCVNLLQTQKAQSIRGINHGEALINQIIDPNCDKNSNTLNEHARRS